MARQNPRKSNFLTSWKCSLISFLVPLHRLSELNEESLITPKRVKSKTTEQGWKDTSSIWQGLVEITMFEDMVFSCCKRFQSSVSSALYLSL